ncbi:phosphomannomutase [Asaia sp. HN010]|uniref:phosphomannomutase n=1 Tax=Asaia sp. HN010 TaxID=3081233 RepID=UPI00301A72E7
MARSGVAFGTSGARGLVTAMTDAVCYAYTVGYLKHLSSVGEFAPGVAVAIAGDLRPSTPRIMRACVAAVIQMKGEAVLCGQVPTPALCSHAFAQGIPSLMVTGSHIPSDRNGIKFNRAHGEFLKSDETAMRGQDVDLPAGWFDTAGALITDIDLPETFDVVPDYITRYTDFFGSEALSGLKLGIYQHSAVGRDVLTQIVTALGGLALPLGRSDIFIPVDTEAVRPEDETLAHGWSAEHALDAILTTDGDSDRPLLADEGGNWLRGDVLGIITARFLGAAAVTTPVSSNTALEKAGFAQEVHRTRIGSPFVVESMTQAALKGVVPSVGYEANGGFLLASPVTLEGRTIPSLPTRDAVLPMLCALVSARQFGSTLGALIRKLPPRFTMSDRLAEIPTVISQAKIEKLRSAPEKVAESLGFLTACGPLSHVDETDGVRMTFKSGENIHLRPSGNAPELRIYVEADTQERAEHLLATGLAAVSSWKRG